MPLDLFSQEIKSAKQKKKEDQLRQAVKEANKEWVKKESEALMAKGIIEREKAKERIMRERLTREKVYADARDARNSK